MPQPALSEILPGSWSLYVEGSDHPSSEIFSFTLDGRWQAKVKFQDGLLRSLYRRMVHPPRGGEWMVRDGDAEQTVLDLLQLRQDHVEMIGSPADSAAAMLNSWSPGPRLEVGRLEFHCTLIEQDTVVGYLPGAGGCPEHRAAWSRIAEPGRSTAPAPRLIVSP